MALVLLGSLVVLDKDTRHSQIFAGMLIVDLSEWCSSSASSLARQAGRFCCVSVLDV